MESGTGSKLTTNYKAGKNNPSFHEITTALGNNKKHDHITKAPPCGHTRPNITTENYPIVKGKGHEACGASGGGGGDDDDEGGKEHKLWACEACGGWGDDEGGKLGKPGKDENVYCHHCDKLFSDNHSYKHHMATRHA